MMPVRRLEPVALREPVAVGESRCQTGPGPTCQASAWPDDAGQAAYRTTAWPDALAGQAGPGRRGTRARLRLAVARLLSCASLFPSYHNFLVGDVHSRPFDTNFKERTSALIGFTPIIR